jgi:hypothetical protein
MIPRFSSSLLRTGSRKSFALKTFSGATFRKSIYGGSQSFSTNYNFRNFSVDSKQNGQEKDEKEEKNNWKETVAAASTFFVAGALGSTLGYAVVETYYRNLEKEKEKTRDQKRLEDTISAVSHHVQVLSMHVDRCNRELNRLDDTVLNINHRVADLEKHPLPKEKK